MARLSAGVLPCRGVGRPSDEFAERRFRGRSALNAPYRVCCRSGRVKDKPRGRAVAGAILDPA